MTTPLDQTETYPRLDPTRLRDRIAGLPDQCWRAWQEGLAFPLPAACAQAQSVVLMGMGGSAIGGDLIAGLAALENSPSVTVLRDYRVPSWIGPTTLAIASSYSGNTEETIAMYRHAREQGAALVAITSGGVLSQMAQHDGVPLFLVPYRGEPRTALGYSFVVPLAFLSKLGILADKRKEMEEAVEAVRGMAGNLATEAPLAQNQAKGLATSLQGRLPVVYGAGFLSSAARRWKTQLNENSKVWAFWEELSELHHNTVEGYGLPPRVREQAFVVLLHSRFLHPRIALRYQITQELLAQNGIPYRQIEGLGNSPLAHLLSTALLGDYTSYYLAMLNQVDPAAMTVIDYLKGRLAGG
ncbi:MAG: bifunctional phosphoglucose/phosphomannose isomerase [Dehalococcoidia bacterium]|nr:bifunctional phosphoglucose/phosphomannose isomerase [Dehalococcoidia bacterium]